MDTDDVQTGLDEELTIREAAEVAERSVKTLRRAIQDGLLPRRYRDGPFGPQLVCTRGDIARFLDNRAAQAAALGQARPLPSSLEPEGTAGAATSSDLIAFATTLHDMQRAMDELRTAIQEAQHRITRLEEASQRQEQGTGQMDLADLQARIAPLEDWIAGHAAATATSARSEGDLAYRLAILENQPALPAIALQEFETRLDLLDDRVATLEQPATGSGVAGDTVGKLAARLASLEEQQQSEATSRLKDSGVREGLHARIEQLEAALAPSERRSLWKRPR